MAQICTHMYTFFEFQVCRIILFIQYFDILFLFLKISWNIHHALLLIQYGRDSARGLLYTGPWFFDNWPIMLITDDQNDYSEAKQYL